MGRPQAPWFCVCWVRRSTWCWWCSGGTRWVGNSRLSHSRWSFEAGWAQVAFSIPFLFNHRMQSCCTLTTRGAVRKSMVWISRSGGDVEMKPGDWICPKCRIVNFARRVECFRCGELKPSGIPKSTFSRTRYASTMMTCPHERTYELRSHWFPIRPFSFPRSWLRSSWPLRAPSLIITTPPRRSWSLRAPPLTIATPPRRSWSLRAPPFASTPSGSPSFLEPWPPSFSKPWTPSLTFPRGCTCSQG